MHLNIETFNRFKTYLIDMKIYKFIYIYGEDVIDFLQNQITYNIHKMQKNEVIYSAHCNSKGKVISTFYLFKYEKGLGLIEYFNTKDIHIKKFKKYSVFSKINFIFKSKFIILGLTGENAQNIIHKFYGTTPSIDNQVLIYKESILIYIKDKKIRYLIITNKQIRNLIKEDETVHYTKNYNYWISTDIYVGKPIIDINNTEKFMPQSLNLKKTKAVDFNKGCYLGQEYIAREEFRRKNKYFLCWLIGKSHIVPKAGDLLKIRQKNIWITIGTVLTFCKFVKDVIWIQAVIYNTDKKNIIINDDYDSHFFIKKIYS